MSDTAEIDTSGFDTIEINGVLYDSKGNVISTKQTTEEKRTFARKTVVEETPKEEPKTPSEIVTQEIDISGYDTVEINGTVYNADGTTVKSTTEKRELPARIVKEEPKKSVSVPSTASTQGQNVQAVELNSVVHDIEDKNKSQEIALLNERIVTERNERIAEDNNLNVAITNEVNTRTSNVQALQQEVASLTELLGTIQSRLTEINALIPLQASEDNQLADKDFVNSSVATNTSNFIGTFNTLEELESQTATNNDYAFWKTTDEDGNVLYKRYKFVADDNTWQFEYDLNNSSFTAEQWASINSGITADKVSDIDSKLPLSGGTLTGKITMPPDLFESNGGALDMNNSDIVGADLISFKDHSEFGEGFAFPRSSGTDKDYVRVSNGDIRIGNVIQNERSVSLEDWFSTNLAPIDSGTGFLKSSGSTGWNAGFRAYHGYKSNVFIGCSATYKTPTAVFIGFAKESDVNSVRSGQYQKLRVAVYMNDNGSLTAWENGVNKAGLGGFSNMDSIRVELVSPTQINIYKNDLLVYNATVEQANYFAGGCVHYLNDQVINLQTGVTSPMTKSNNGTWGLLGGAKQSTKSNFVDLLNNEICSGLGIGGICGGSINTTSTSLGIPSGWYNYLYIPHRTGVGGGNMLYGTLLVFPMTSNSSTIYYIHRINGTNYNAISK